MERAHGETECQRVQRRAEGLVEEEFDSRVPDVEVWLGDGVGSFGLVESLLVGGGGGGEGRGGGAEGVGGEGGFEELLPRERGLVWMWVGGMREGEGGDGIGDGWWRIGWMDGEQTRGSWAAC